MPENYTLTYSESVKGWPSFYSYYPDFILGMNQYLYTFKGGNLYRHNTGNVDICRAPAGALQISWRRIYVEY